MAGCESEVNKTIEEIAVQAVRRCRACRELKSITAFYTSRNRFGRTYAQRVCKVCRSARVQAAKRRAVADPAEAERRRLWRKEHKRHKRRAAGIPARGPEREP